ncbi:hypothetical protein [Roseibium alexandrii]|uniref:hypothetical protein n=1 Tax=Roseibium alexandrii TaxID=388408 RepID=UPI003751AB3B
MFSPVSPTAIMAVAALLIVTACASQSTSEATGWFGTHDGVPPKANKVYICHGFGCVYKTPVEYSRQDLARLRVILASGRASPSAERQAIAHAVAWQERRVAVTVGSEEDVGGFDIENAGVSGQMDCIDESTNTTSLLLVTQKHKMLRYHRVSAPVARGFFLDGRYPHATATVTEKKTGTVYAVDSWVNANGKRPDIMPIDHWLAEGDRWFVST